MPTANYFVFRVDNSSLWFCNRSTFNCLTGVRKHFIVDIWLWRNIELLYYFPDFCDTKKNTAQFQQDISKWGEIISEEVFWPALWPDILSIFIITYNVVFLFHDEYSVETQININNINKNTPSKNQKLCVSYN